MKHFIALNDNQEYNADEVSLVCEVGCNFTINSKNTEVLNRVLDYVKTLPNDDRFMIELGESFVTLVHKYVSEFSANENR